MAISTFRPPFVILAATALLLAQGVDGLLECWLEDYWGPTLFCVAAIIGGLGLVYRAWWSRPIIIALVLLLFLAGIVTGWRLADSTLFRNRHAVEIVLMLLPGLVYLGLSAFCAYVAVVHVPTRRRRPKP